MVHRQLAETIDVGRILASDGLRRRGVSVGRPAAGVDHRRTHLLGHHEQIFEGVEVGIDHDFLIVDRRVTDGRFVEDVIEPKIEKAFEIFPAVDISRNDLTGKPFQVFIVAETFQIPVGKGLSRSEQVEHYDFGIGKILLKVESQIGPDESGASRDEYRFSVEVHRFILFQYFIEISFHLLHLL